MEEWNEAKRSFKFDSDYESQTESDSSFVMASVTKTEYSEVQHESLASKIV